MLSKLIIRNFQKHRKLAIVFGNVTTIIGATDSGKSAIVRALRWALLNQPRGDYFKRDGAKECSVSLSFDDHKLTRKKGSENVYKLDDQEYKAFGNNVPDTIQDLLRVNDLNFQQQHDPSFWLSLSSAEVAKELNAIINMELMDKVLNRVAKDEREAKSRVNYEQERQDELKKHLEESDWVPNASKAFHHIQAICDKTNAILVRMARLKRAIEILTEHREKVRKAELALETAKRILSMAESAESLQDKVQTLETSLQYLNTSQLAAALKKYKELKKELKLCEELPTKESTSRIVCPKCGNVIKPN